MKCCPYACSQLTAGWNTRMIKNKKNKNKKTSRTCMSKGNSPSWPTPCVQLCFQRLYRTQPAHINSIFCHYRVRLTWFFKSNVVQCNRKFSARDIKNATYWIWCIVVSLSVRRNKSIVKCRASPEKVFNRLYETLRSACYLVWNESAICSIAGG